MNGWRSRSRSRRQIKAILSHLPELPLFGEEARINGRFGLTNGFDLTNGIYDQIKSINVADNFAHYANTEAVGGDSVMLIRKNASSDEAAALTPGKLPVEPAAVMQQRLVQEVEITSLEIEQDQDQGCDPYNRTGQFCIVEISKDE